MSTLKANNVANNSGGPSRSMDDVVNGVARAWVTFNGTGVVAIKASYNVSSVTDNGVADYTIGFTNAMQDANYTVVGLVSNTTQAQLRGLFTREDTPQTTTSVRVNSTSTNSGATTPQDPLTVMAAIFR